MIRQTILNFIGRFWCQVSTVQDESNMVLLGNCCSRLVPDSEVQHWIPSQICCNMLRVSVREFTMFICPFHIHILQTYSMDSVTVIFWVVLFSARDKLLDLHCLDLSDMSEASETSSTFGISIQDDINHWVAAAYCRHSNFSFSTFCNKKYESQEKASHDKKWESRIKIGGFHAIKDYWLVSICWSNIVFY